MAIAENLQQAIETLRGWIKESNRAVFFGGAGVSTESGIPDFRSTDGLYNQEYAYPPETILSHTFFERQTAEFYRFYKAKMIFTEARPNACHRKLAELEEAGHLRSVVTQNIDGLHQAAGSKRVLELHGSVLRNYCTRCGRFHTAGDILAAEGIPHCHDCGGLVKPDVVLYEEGLDDEILLGSVRDISAADMLIVGGTSLVVYPAAGLLNYYRGRRLVLINMTPTPADSRADLVIHAPIGEVFAAL